MNRILLVEDDEVTGSLLAELIKIWGYNVDWAVDGYSAKKKLPVFCPSLILCDYLLSDMDGIDLCKQLKACNSDLKAVLITAAPEDQIGKITTEASASGLAVLRKPFLPKDLKMILEAVFLPKEVPV